MVLDDLVQAVKQLQLIRLVVLVQLDSESESLLNSSILLLCHLQFVHESGKLFVNLFRLPLLIGQQSLFTDWSESLSQSTVSWIDADLMKENITDVVV